MNRSDTAKIMAFLAAAYPGFYSKQTREDKLAAVNVWADIFAEDAADTVYTAVRAFVATHDSDYPPSIGQIKAQIYRLTHKVLSEADAWSMVYDTICNHYDHPYDALPEMAKRAIGSEAVVLSLGQSSVQELQTVVASTFKRTYRSLMEDYQQREMLPADIRGQMDALNGAAEQKRLEAGA